MTDISKTAMLVSVTIKLEGLLGEKRDAKATGHVERRYKVQAKRVKASKYLIDRTEKHVKRIVAQQQAIRACLYKYTFPWGEGRGATRLLASKVHEEFDLAINAEIHKLWQYIDDYIRVYPSLVTKSKVELAGLYEQHDYPPVNKIRRMFVARVNYWPMPQAGHFVADIANEAADAAKRAIIAETNTRTLDAVGDMVERVKEAVQKYATKLAEYDPTSLKGKRVKGIFRDSLVENVRDIGRLIGLLNFSNDERLNRLGVMVEKLGSTAAYSLRLDKPWANERRTNKIKEAKGILKELEKFQRSYDDVDALVASIPEYMHE